MQIEWLKEITVLVLGHYVPAPLAGYILGRLGARIIKVEPPGGDFMRTQPPYFESGDYQQSAFFLSVNAGTESISLNWKTEEGKQILENLWKKSDIVLDGNRAGYMQRILGDSPTELFPETIYVSLTGLGTQGPFSGMAAHDNNALALSGLLSFTSPGEAGSPAPFAAPVADMASAQMAVICSLAGLIGKSAGKSPRINSIDTSILHSAFFFQLLPLASYNLTQKNPTHGKEWMNGGLPNYSPYPTSDGRFVFLGPIEPHLFAKFLEQQGRMDLLSLYPGDIPAMKKELSLIFRQQSAEEWRKYSKENDVCLTVVNTLEEALEEPQVKALGLYVEQEHPEFGPVKMPGFPAGFGESGETADRPVTAPGIGEDSRKICEGMLGMPPETVSKLIEAGVLRTP